MKLSAGRIIALAVLATVVVTIVLRLSQGQMGMGYYEVTGVAADRKKVDLSRVEVEDRVAERQREVRLEAGFDQLPPDQQEARLSEAATSAYRAVTFSWPRTIGLWVAAFSTLAVLSFLYRDNPVYRIAEHLFVGSSAAYVMVITFWDSYVGVGLQSLFPRLVKYAFNPTLDLDSIVESLALRSWFAGIIGYEEAVGRALAASWYQLMDVWFWIPTIMGIMLLWRLAPKGKWLGRWPLAFLFGAFMGARLIAHLHADFVAQIDAAIQPLVVLDYAADENGQPVLDAGRSFYLSFTNFVLLFGTLCVLIYFFFSVEHRGVVGGFARLGIWVLMVAFGAGFGYTVMGRIALLVMRFQFLVRDWLNIESLDYLIT